jgi:hypothetical protein
MDNRIHKKLISLPLDLKVWLEHEAARNLSSANSEIVRAVRQRMESERRETEVSGR